MREARSDGIRQASAANHANSSRHGDVDQRIERADVEEQRLNQARGAGGGREPEQGRSPTSRGRCA